MKDLKVALVHEWLISWGGSESVLLSLSRLFPDAPIFTSIYAPDSRVRLAFAECEIEPGVLQLVPGVRITKVTFSWYKSYWRKKEFRLESMGYSVTIRPQQFEISKKEDWIFQMQTTPRTIKTIQCITRLAPGANQGFAFRAPKNEKSPKLSTSKVIICNTI